MQDTKELLCISVTEAAKLIGVSRNTGYMMAKMGQLPIIRCGERRILVPMSALKRKLDQVKTNIEQC